MTDTDVFISGAGLAGLTAAAAFAARGFRVVLADPRPPAGDRAEPGADLRSTAYLRPARTLFEDAGLWDVLAPHATPLETLRVVDTEGDPPRIRTDRSFRSDDLGEAPFGWNIPNHRARTALIAHLSDRIDLRLGTGFAGIVRRDAEALVRLNDGAQIRAKLAVAADGRASPLREASGIGARITRYGQKALAFAVTHELPHDGVSTELYRSGGAFTLVPLADHDGRPASAIVWMEDGPVAARLAALDSDALSAAATERSAHVLGPLTVITRAQLWPIILQEAERFTAKRVALIAEAAHVLPPIGAQGLNTSLRDVAELVGIAGDAPDVIGTPAMLDAYARKRVSDVRARVAAIDLFNRVCRADAAPVRALRSTGLAAVHDIAPIRQAIMRAGLGA